MRIDYDKLMRTAKDSYNKSGISAHIRAVYPKTGALVETSEKCPCSPVRIVSLANVIRENLLEDERHYSSTPFLGCPLEGTLKLSDFCEILNNPDNVLSPANRVQNILLILGSSSKQCFQMITHYPQGTRLQYYITEALCLPCLNPDTEDLLSSKLSP